jgi:hypothetical protein
MSQGEDLCDVVRSISAKYGVTDNRLYHDWKDRGTWGDYVLIEFEEEFIVQDYLQEIREIEKTLWEIALNSPDDKSRIAALAQLKDIKFKRLTANQELGRIHKEPVKIQIQEHIDRIYSTIQEVAGDDKVLQGRIIDKMLYERGN